MADNTREKILGEKDRSRVITSASEPRNQELAVWVQGRPSPDVPGIRPGNLARLHPLLLGVEKCPDLVEFDAAGGNRADVGIMESKHHGASVAQKRSDGRKRHTRDARGSPHGTPVEETPEDVHTSPMG